jgi:glycerate 2-kinase
MDPEKDLREIARASLEAVDPRAIVTGSVRIDAGALRVQTRNARQDFDLARFPRIFVMGFGKAAGPMARAIEDVLGTRIDKGLIVVKPGHEQNQSAGYVGAKSAGYVGEQNQSAGYVGGQNQSAGYVGGLQRIRQVPGGHPVPDENSARAAAEIAALADEADARTLVIVLISGGGSSLLAAPMSQGSIGVTLADIQETTRQLLACGAAIGEMNCIRKHLLLLAGGRLAQRIAPATSISLVLSDVVGDDLQTIASGPTCPDSTTYESALSIISRYGIGPTLPRPVMEVLRNGAAGKIPETPKPGAPELSTASHTLIGTNLLALKSAAGAAERLGYNTLILTSRMTGEAREAARLLAAVAGDVAASGLPRARPACILAGGETTVTVRGKGKGGRNQELAIAFLQEMEKEPALLSGTHVLSFSTDGEDGPTDAAGGFAHAALVEAARAAGLSVQDSLRENDSYNFLKRLDGLFITGPTNTNVCDIQVMLIV